MIDIKGVEVLEVINNSFTIKQFVLTMIMVFIFVTILGFVVGLASEMPGFGLILGVITSLVIVVLATILSLSELSSANRTQYKVFLTEEVNMEEFLQEYVIISQEGKILVVELIQKEERG